MIIVFTLLFIAALFAWYEGSELYVDSFEWNRSTFFSHLFGGEITSRDDINMLDQFVYAAKFKPLYPFAMVLCIFYLLCLLSSIIKKKSLNIYTILTLFLGVIHFILSLFLLNGSTIGSFIFCVTFFVIGCFFFVFSYLNRTSLKLL
ncbi:DUF4306 domain-containing protein [Salibacterium sp. K-3]